jgi:sulfate-transporting ATPase
MIAVRGNERAAAGLGINVVMTKLLAFAIAAAITGLGGVLVAFRGSVALFTQFSVLSNITAVSYSVVGGAGSVLGALFGSTLQPAGIGNLALNSIFGISPVKMAMLGGFLLIFTIITSPDGIAAATVETVRSVRRRLPVPARRSRAERWRREHLGGSEPGGEARHRVKAAALTVRSVEVTFASVRAVADVSLEVRPGEIVGVVGANGAGKTTLIDAITGFVRSSGRIELGGVDLSAMSAHARARAGISRSWQSLELIEDLPVLDNLRIASDVDRSWSVLSDLVWPRQGKPTAAMVRAIEVLQLGERLGDMPGDLGTGQRKLVALARAIATEPSILLLDEPCSGLDHHEREEVGEVIRALAESWGMGVLLVEHDVHLVRRVSDRIVVLDFGKVIAEGEPNVVLSDPGVVAAFLGDADVGEAGKGMVLA